MTSDGESGSIARASRRGAVLVCAGLAALAACSRSADVLDGCGDAEGWSSICEFSNPEDIALVPGTPWIVVSEFPPEGEAGALVAFRAIDERRRTLYPDGPDEGLLSAAAPMAGWGDPECPGPPDRAVFAPHGIDVRSDPNGAGVLAVVNHGGRHSVELFEIGYAAGGPALGWRGCVPMPPGVWPNDVAFWPGGGFAVSHMMTPMEESGGMLSGLKLAVGADTGRVLRWTAHDGMRPIEGSEGSGPNGVAVSADGTEVFFAEWGGRRLVRLRLDERPGRRELELDIRPDNLSWSRDGRLLVAGQRGGFGEILGCAEIERGTCALGYAVLAVEPSSLESRTLVESREEGEVTGAVSSALHVGGELFLGTFAGDRVVRTRFPD
ncbi:MAG: hypothetical protein ACQGVK_16985 [Myxococcota bacterium]